MKSKHLFLVGLVIVMLALLGVGVYVIHRHSSPASTAPSGIEGTVTYGPLCPTEPCPLGSAQPDYTFYVIASKMDGDKAAQAMPDSSGKYKLTVPPGTYQVTVSRSFASAQGSQPPAATVKSGQYTRLNLSYDTGIR